MNRKQCVAGAVMVLAVTVMAEEIFKEGFNSGFVPSYQAGPGTFGFQFVNHVPNGTHGLSGTEGDGYGWQNSNNSRQEVPASVIGRMTIGLETVKKIDFEIQLADNNQAAGLTQLLTNNWKVEVR